MNNELTLTMANKPYPAYKSSGIECLGEIPEHWESKRLKYLLSALESGMRETGGGNQLDEGIFSIGGEHISWGGQLLLESPKYISCDYFQRLLKGKVKLLDVLLVKDGATIGKTVIIKEMPFESCAVNEHVFILRNKNETDPIFLYYLIVSEASQSQILNLIKGSAQPGLNSAFAGLTWCCMPPLAEQQAIADYLDRQTAKIDTLISKLERLIELLKEKRTSLISQAVTKGLDPSAPMKDSGIEWLGEIPEHWETKKIKFVARNPSEKRSKIPDELAYIGLENIESWTGRLLLNHQQDEVDSNVGLFIKNDVLFGKLRPYLAKGFIAESGGACTTELLILRTSDQMMNSYLLFLLLSKGFIDTINSSTYGTKMPRTNWGQIGNSFLPLPNKREQNAIVNFIQNRLIAIDEAIAGLGQLTVSMQEYREAIIFHAITGKIDVRKYYGKKR